MFIIIATAFSSYTQPFAVLLTVPFGFMGAIFGHLLFGYDVSFMSMMGMVTLSGVVVNDTIVLIDCVNEYVSRGEPFMNAVRLAGARRFRSIFLTSVSTVLGVMPLVLERDIQAIFLIPMAISISAGVAFATMITLILTPCALVILNDLRRVTRRLLHGEWPTREEVEPARPREDEHEETTVVHTPPVTGTA
jgi:multidrug efflux pump subunit AcrB